MADLPSVPDLRERFDLTVRQARFVRELPGTDPPFNQTEAAKRAGYSKKTAHATASRMMNNVKVQAALEAVTDPLLEEADIRAEDVLEEYRRLAFSSLRDVVHWGPGGVELRDSDDLPDTVAAAVREVEVNEWRQEDGTVRRRAKVKMHSKEKALDKLGQFCGLWRDPNEVRVQILQVFERLSDEELRRIVEMDEEEVLELMSDGDLWRLPDAGG